MPFLLVGILAVGVATALGATLLTAITIGIGFASTFGGIFGGSHKNTAVAKSVQRFNKTVNPEEPRKIVFGKTAAALDVRFWEVWGTGAGKYDEVIALASHRINAVLEFYLENELAIDASGTVQTTYSAVLSRAYNLGAYGQTALSVGSATQWTSAATFDGVAHAVYKWVPNDKALPNGVPNRYTQIIEGAPVYDPRRDSTVAGGSGAHRITDRTTWDYAALDANSVPIGRNNALQVLWYLLGWYVPNAQTAELVLTCGRGIDPTDINLASFVTAANNCEAAGYYTDCILSTGDAHTDNENKMTASGLIGTLIDPGGLWSYYANVDDSATVDAYLTDDDITDVAAVTWNDFLPMSEQFAQVVGKFNDPGNNALYQPRAYPMVRDTTYETALGVKRRKTIDFDVIQDSLLAQKLARLALNTGQFQGEFTASVLYRIMKAQLWSVVSYTSDRFGWTKLFRIRGFTFSPNHGIQVSLRETNATIWAAGSVTTPVTIGAGTKFNPRMEVAVAGLSAATYTSTASDGTKLDGMLLSWTAAPANVLRTEIQFRQNGLTSWETAAPINGDTSSVAIANLLSGTVYNVRARHITNFEVESAWVDLSPNFTIGTNRIVLWATVAGTTNAPENNADVTSTAQIVVDLSIAQKVVEADYLGALIGSPMPVTFSPSVKKGGTSVKLDNAATYAITKPSDGSSGADGGTVAVDNTNGSSTKGDVSASAFDTGSVQIKFRLTVSYNALIVGQIDCIVKKNIGAAPTGGGKIATVPADQTISTTSYAEVSTSSHPSLVLTSGEKLYASMSASYSAGTGTGSRTGTFKHQYSTDNATWTDFGAAGAGYNAMPGYYNGYGEYIDPIDGSVTLNQSVSGLSANTYYYRTIGITSNGSKSIVMGGQTITYEAKT